MNAMSEYVKLLIRRRWEGVEQELGDIELDIESQERYLQAKKERKEKLYEERDKLHELHRELK